MWRLDLACVAFAAVVAPSSRAQGEPVPLVPESPRIVLQLDGPARIVQRCLPTDVGSVLAGESAEDLWGQSLGLLDAVIASLGEGAPNTDALRDALASYAGRITFALGYFGPNDAKHRRGHGVVVFAPDGKTDLAELDRAIAASVEGMRLESRVLSVGDRRLEVLEVPHVVGMTMPVAVGEHRALVFGHDIDSAARHYFGSNQSRKFTPDAELARSVIGVRLDLARMVEDLAADLKSWVREPDPERVLTDLGFFGLCDLQLLVRPIGSRMEAEFSLLMDDDERGIFDGMFPSVAAVPRLTWAVPPDEANWKVVKLRPDRVIGAAFDAIEGAFSWRQYSADEFGADLERDVFAYFEDEMLVMGKVEGGLFGGAEDVVSIVVRVREGFDAGWNKVAKQSGFAASGTTGPGGATIHVGDWSGMDSAYVRVDDLFVWANGPGAVQRARAVAKHLEEKRERKQALPLGMDRIDKLKKHAPPGFNGCGQVEVHLASTVLFELVEPQLPDQLAASIKDLLQRFHGLLDEQGLGSASVLFGHSGDRWRARAYW